MKTFLKANMASLIASACDYGFTAFLKELVNAGAYISGVLGTVLGGVINFFICRYWVFGAGSHTVFSQGKRYIITWIGNLVLNTTGYYLLLNYTGLHYIIAKLITSLTVAVAYNYPMQKKYVFKNT